MQIDLFKTLEAPSYYGALPDFQPGDTEHVISAYFDWQLVYSFDLALTGSLNEATDGTLSIADVNFYDADACRRLIAWIDTNQEDINQHGLGVFFATVRNFACTAIQWGTGIAIEL